MGSLLPDYLLFEFDISFLPIIVTWVQVLIANENIPICDPTCGERPCRKSGQTPRRRKAQGNADQDTTGLPHRWSCCQVVQDWNKDQDFKSNQSYVD